MLSDFLGDLGVTLVIYLFFDGKDGGVAGNVKQTLIDQAIFGVVSAITMGLTFLLIVVFLWPILVLLGLVWFCCSIYACFKVINGGYHYQLLKRF